MTFDQIVLACSSVVLWIPADLESLSLSKLIKLSEILFTQGETLKLDVAFDSSFSSTLRKYVEAICDMPEKDDASKV